MCVICFKCPRHKPEYFCYLVPAPDNYFEISCSIKFCTFAGRYVLSGKQNIMREQDVFFICLKLIGKTAMKWNTRLETVNSAALFHRVSFSFDILLFHLDLRSSLFWRLHYWMVTLHHFSKKKIFHGWRFILFSFWTADCSICTV